MTSLRATHTTSAIAAVVLALVPLAGCGSSSTAPSTAPSISQPSTPGTSPSVDLHNAAIWQSGPGFIGPYKVGTGAQTLERQGLVTAHEDTTCDFKWDTPQWVLDEGIGTEFRGGNPDVLKDVTAGLTIADGTADNTFKTAEGVGLGTSVAELQSTYSDLHYGEWPGEGATVAGWFRTTPQGSILFSNGAKDAEGNFVSGDGSTITQIQVTAETDSSKFAADGGGC